MVADDKGYFGEDAADLGNPAEERDVQTAPAGGKAANVGTPFEPDKGDDDTSTPYTTTLPQ